MVTAPPYSFWKRIAFLLPIAVIVFGIDQASKQWAVTHLAGHAPQTYGAIFTLIYAENTGAWGSLGAHWGDTTRLVVLGLLPAAVLIGITIYALISSETTSADLLGTALVLAGGAGNLVDRFRLGYVQDFLYIGYGPVGTNIFNIADTVVMVGLGILLFSNFKSQQKSNPPSSQSA